MNSQLDIIYQVLQKISKEDDLPKINSKIKEFIHLCHKMKHSGNNISIEFSYIIIQILARFHLLDQQLLLSKAFFLSLQVNKINLTEIIEQCLKFTSTSQFNIIYINGKINSIKIIDLNQFKLTLIYEFLQNVENSQNFSNVFSEIFNFLNSLSSGYSKLSPLVFKTFSLLLKKLFEWEMHNLIDNNRQKKLYNLIHSNWESPVTGISEYNCNLFKMLIEIDNLNHEIILHAILREQSWYIKSKYLMLRSLIPKFDMKRVFSEHPEFFKGLIVSLSHTYLAPSGRDVYKLIINNLSYEDWEYYCMEYIISDCIKSDKNSVTYKNFINYWLEPTLKGYPSVYDQLYELNKSDYFFIIHLIKIRKKNGINSTYLLDESNDLIICLRNSNEFIRSEAFFALCVHYKCNISEYDFSYIKEFLNDNINSDSSPLRESIVKGLKDLILKIITKIYDLDAKKKNIIPIGNQIDEIQELKHVITWLHIFLLNNLCEGSNYQRKITSLRLYKIILETLLNFKNTKLFKGLKIKEANISKEFLVLYTSQESLNILLNMIWDPTNDIRDYIADIIITFFPKGETSELIKIGLELCSTSLFYEAASGGSVFKIIAKWSEDNKNNIEKLLLLAQTNLGLLNDNLLENILGNKNIHGYYIALQYLIPLKNIRLDISQEDFLLSLLEDTINIFLKFLSKETLEGLAPSFSDMGKAIDSLIEEHLDLNGENLFLSPTHQLLLNSIWIHLKEACILACKLGKKNHSLSNRCGLIIIKVLKKCRHKGAIEAAGLALGELVEFASKEPTCFEFIFNWLQECLDSIGISNSITRRSAGMAILVHQIVAHDQRLEKPTLELCITKLLEISQTPIKEDINHETSDLKQAIALHLITILLKDAVLNSGLIKWLSKITLVCFKYLNSKIWTVRNAALQLFGALVPKLVGQKKNQEEILNTGNTSAEEFIFNFTEISDYLLELLTHEENSNSSSLLVSALTLCSELKVGIKMFRSNFIQEIIERYITIFNNLLSSRIYIIRRLAAKSFANFCDYSNLKDCIITIKNTISLINSEDNNTNNNKIHGLVLTLYFLQMRYRVNSLTNKAENVINIDELNFRRISYFTSSFLQDIQPTKYLSMDKIIKIRSHENENKIGIDQWIKKQIKSFVLNATENELLNGIDLIQEESVALDQLFDYLEKRIKNNNLSLEGMKKILQYIRQKITEPHLINEAILRTTLWIFCEYKLSIDLKMDLLNNSFNYINKHKKESLESALIVPVLLILFPQNFDFNHNLITILVNEIQNRSNPKIFNENFRLHASFALFVIGEKLLSKFFNNEIIMENILNSTITLLQDENIDIRKQTTKFASSILKEHNTMNPNICLRKLIDHIFLKVFFTKKTLFLFYWKNIFPLDHNVEYNNEQILIKSPFQLDIVNIYAEEIRIIDIYHENLSNFVKELENENKEECKKYINENINSLNQILNNVIENNKDSKKKIDIHLTITIKKLIYTLKILKQLNFEENYDNYQKKLEVLLNVKKIY